MKKLVLVLLLAELLVGALPPRGLLPDRTPIQTHTAAPAEKTGDLYEVLERIGAEYDPAAAGAVGAIRWAEKLLDAWAGTGRDRETVRSAAEEYVSAHGAAGLAERLSRLLWAARQLTSGADLGLMNEPGGPARSWSREDAESFFRALCDGAGIPFPAQ